MRKLVAHTFVTLDGVAVIENVIDTIVELRDTPEVLDDFFARVAEEDAMLLGRVTYQEWADHWPTSTSQPFADHINGVPKYVVSRTLRSAPWADGSATLIGGDLTDAVTALKEQPGGTIGVHGSPTLVDALLHADLLDELHLEVYPVIAGEGGRLFKAGQGSKRLELSGSKIAGNGVAMLSYRSRS